MHKLEDLYVYSTAVKMPKEAGKKEFQWTDDEMELLLNVTHEFKVRKISENVDWESVKTKYDDILELMKTELPCTPEEAKQITNKDYQRSKFYHQN